MLTISRKEFAVALLVSIGATTFLVLSYAAVDYAILRHLPKQAYLRISDNITPIVILFSAITAGTLAMFNMESARRTARLQETLRVINNSELDREFIKARSAWSQYKGNGDIEYDEDLAAVIAIILLKTIASSLERKALQIEHVDVDKKERLNEEVENLRDISKDTELLRRELQDGIFVITYLNSFELIAIGINKKIIDEEMYRQWHEGHFINVWNCSVAAVGVLRYVKKNKRLFKQWERVARQWSGEKGETIAVVPQYNSRQLAKITIDYHATKKALRREREN
ncbi:DUF4760 domain-containing protein [Pontivivens ytuae]|uniref:DUF4760 domain-containing protein n=1 Tax=Pontivivens ytuae TaxID=2789856 RepID=A0A7S9LT40_9RHOB|nr:DUF4760 domain-containing protein [Pontivivens ytuae]QPH54747.1 DUF4760 domain-containing protein [Pontivivens ytuae]